MVLFTWKTPFLVTRPSQLVAVDVVFKHGLLHVVAGHHADGTKPVTLLVLLQFLRGYEGEALLAVTTHQRLPGTQTRDRSTLGGK